MSPNTKNNVEITTGADFAEAMAAEMDQRSQDAYALAAYAEACEYFGNSGRHDSLEMSLSECIHTLKSELDAKIDTYREQYEAEQKAAYDLRCCLNEVAEYFGINVDLWPAEKVKRLKQMKDDKDDIETKWEELCKALWAHGPESDPLLGSDTNDMIHARAMEWIKTMTSDEF